MCFDQLIDLTDSVIAPSITSSPVSASDLREGDVRTAGRGVGRRRRRRGRRSRRRARGRKVRARIDAFVFVGGGALAPLFSSSSSRVDGVDAGTGPDIVVQRQQTTLAKSECQLSSAE